MVWGTLGYLYPGNIQVWGYLVHIGTIDTWISGIPPSEWGHAGRPGFRTGWVAWPPIRREMCFPLWDIHD